MLNALRNNYTMAKGGNKRGGRPHLIVDNIGRASRATLRYDCLANREQKFIKSAFPDVGANKFEAGTRPQRDRRMPNSGEVLMLPHA